MTALFLGLILICQPSWAARQPDLSVYPAVRENLNKGQHMAWELGYLLKKQPNPEQFECQAEVIRATGIDFADEWIIELLIRVTYPVSEDANGNKEFESRDIIVDSDGFFLKTYTNYRANRYFETYDQNDNLWGFEFDIGLFKSDEANSGNVKNLFLNNQSFCLQNPKPRKPRIDK